VDGGEERKHPDAEMEIETMTTKTKQRIESNHQTHKAEKPVYAF
jgi:hypothetical protein